MGAVPLIDSEKRAHDPGRAKKKQDGEMPTTRRPSKTPSATSQRPRWTPFQRAQQVTDDTTDEVGQIYQNSLYTVIVSINREHSMAKLSIRRNDREAVHDWRDLQRIKNELVGAGVRRL